MNLSKSQAKENLLKLIEKFEKEKNANRINSYNEEATKIAFIQPFLKMYWIGMCIITMR